jgi:hypothetical protein
LGSFRRRRGTEGGVDDGGTGWKRIESRCNAKEKYLHKMSVSFCGRTEMKQPYTTLILLPERPSLIQRTILPILEENPDPLQLLRLNSYCGSSERRYTALLRYGVLAKCSLALDLDTKTVVGAVGRLKEGDDVFSESSPGPVRRVLLGGGSFPEVDEAEVTEMEEKGEVGEDGVNDVVARGVKALEEWSVLE